MHQTNLPNRSQIFLTGVKPEVWAALFRVFILRCDLCMNSCIVLPEVKYWWVEWAMGYLVTFKGDQLRPALCVNGTQEHKTVNTKSLLTDDLPTLLDLISTTHKSIHLRELQTLRVTFATSPYPAFHRMWFLVYSSGCPRCRPSRIRRWEVDSGGSCSHRILMFVC